MICKFNSVFLIYFVIILNITQTFSNFAEWNLLRVDKATVNFLNDAFEGNHNNNKNKITKK